MTTPPVVVGWKAIACRISEVTGVQVSVDQVKRMAARQEHRLQAVPIGRGRRSPRAIRQDRLDRFAREEFKAAL
jgi:hypothetical protein